MPTYQYACTACDERLEAVQSFTDAPLAECGACGGTLRKVFSAVGVVFKGSGFYKTDSRAKSTSSASSETSGTQAAKGESSSDGKSATKADVKSESKGDPKSASKPAATAATPASKTA